MKEQRKTEDDRIAFLIHFATGSEEPNAALLTEKHMEALAKVATWNPNGVNAAHRNDVPVFLG